MDKPSVTGFEVKLLLCQKLFVTRLADAASDECVTKGL